MQDFEHDFAEYLGVRHVIGVSSGTDALHLSMRALGVGPGDEVITTPLTFIGTVEAIVQTGAQATFVDIDPATCNISAHEVRRYLEGGRFRSANGPKAILPVHLYGQSANMSAIEKISAAHGVPVVEDCCQAHLATADGRPVGTVGAAGAFSFYPTKNLG